VRLARLTYYGSTYYGSTYYGSTYYGSTYYGVHVVARPWLQTVAASTTYGCRCASPGSKTTQALEALAPKGSSSGGGGGYMVANDMVPARCQMLLRRCAALGELSSQLLVSCHPAQRMPQLARRGAGGEGGEGGEGEEGSYDRIVCDVPCSGDGTTRKNPNPYPNPNVNPTRSTKPDLALALALALTLTPTLARHDPQEPEHLASLVDRVRAGDAPAAAADRAAWRSAAAGGWLGLGLGLGLAHPNLT
jgi:hypothetical protein